jgi:hypothetical protein
MASVNPNSGVPFTVNPSDNNGANNGVTLFTRIYGSNMAVTVTAPAGANGNAFVKWQRDGLDLTTNFTATLTMDANHLLTAVYGGTGLVGYWKLDDGSGVVALDSSGFGNHGRLTNGPVFTNAPGGRLSGALIFDGVNDHVVVPDTDLLDFNARSFTVALWVKTSKTGPQALLEKQHQFFSGLFILALNRDNAVPGGFSLWHGSDWIDSNFRGVSDGQWHHLAATYDGASFRLYRDGILDKTQTTVASYVNTIFPMNFGRFASGNVGWYFQGLMDDIQLYNRALSDSEIAVMASAAPAPPPPMANALPLRQPPQLSILWLKSGAVRLQVSGEAGHTCHLQAGSDLEDWTDISTIVIGLDGWFEFIDSNVADWPARFYRIVEP